MLFECDTKGGALRGEDGLSILASTPVAQSSSRFKVYFTPIDNKNCFTVDCTINGKTTTITGLTVQELSTSYSKCENENDCRTVGFMKSVKLSIGGTSRTQVFIHTTQGIDKPLECIINPGITSGLKNYTIHGNNGADLAVANQLGKRNIVSKVGFKTLINTGIMAIIGPVAAGLALAGMEKAAESIIGSTTLPNKPGNYTKTQKNVEKLIAKKTYNNTKRRQGRRQTRRRR